MVCARCGATNTETAPVCRNCGASLQRRSTIPNMEQKPTPPSRNDGGGRSAISIDELPTAHMPGVPGPSGYVTASQIPHGEQFPLELAQTQQPLTRTTEDTPSLTSPSATPQPISDPQLSPLDIADYPTKTGVPIPPKASSPGLPFATTDPAAQDAVSPAPSLSNIPPATPPRARPGMLGLPSRPKVGNPPSQIGTNTPPSQPGIIVPPPTQSGIGTPPPPQPDMTRSTQAPPSQPGIGTPPPSQTNMARPSQPPLPRSNPGVPPSQMQMPAPQPNMSTPPMSPAGIAQPPAQPGPYGMNTPPPQVQPGIATPPGMNTPPMQANRQTPPSYAGLAASGSGAPPSQPSIGKPPSPVGMDNPPSQAGGNWSDGQRATSMQNTSAPTQMGNGYPGQSDPAVTNGPTAQANTPAAAPEELHRFAQPLPRWITLGGPVVVVLALLGLTLLNPDWATGAMIASLIAMTLAVLLAIATGVRVALGMLKEANPRRRAQMFSTALLVVLLLLVSGGGLSQQNTLHLTQARYLESHQNWAQAISEYQSGGEKSSASVDVARTYDEWGEAQSGQQQYAGAVTSFSVVIQDYQQATSEFKRAQSDLIAAYLGWADQASQQEKYAEATAHYDALLSLVFCSASCTQQAQPKDATAYYHLAEQQLAAHQYTQSVNAYKTLMLRFPKAPENSQIHAHYAQALWGQGQQQVTTACSNALADYRLLTKFYADTPQAKLAATALTQSIQVTGHFTQAIPGSPFHPTAFLVQGLFVGIQQYQFPPLLTHAPTASIHPDGTFTFTSVRPGTYELIWSSDSTLHFYYASSGQKVLYAGPVGPLCTYNYGDINQAIPTK